MIKDAGYRAAALAKVALAQAKKDPRTAARTVRKVLHLLAQVKNPRTVHRPFTRPRRPARRRPHGQVENPQTIRPTPDFQNQLMARTDIVFAQLRMKQFAQALQTARDLNFAEWEATLLRSIAKAQVAAGKVKEARAWIRNLKHPYIKALALIGIADGRWQRKPR
jgi:hypothetical protein